MQINTTKSCMRHAKSVINTIRENEGLPFGEVLPTESIAQHLGDHPYRARIFTPTMTIFGFLSQVMGEDQSCQQAVAQVIAHFARQGRKMPSSNTAAYCKARRRLPEELLSGLAKGTAQELEKAVASDMLWRNRHIKLPDGTTVSMPDTIDNQAAWPQSRTQKKGLVFQ
jgi:hypothetical protein